MFIYDRFNANIAVDSIANFPTLLSLIKASRQWQLKFSSIYSKVRIFSAKSNPSVFKCYVLCYHLLHWQSLSCNEILLHRTHLSRLTKRSITVIPKAFRILPKYATPMIFSFIKELCPCSWRLYYIAPILKNLIKEHNSYIVYLLIFFLNVFLFLHQIIGFIVLFWLLIYLLDILFCLL